MMDPIRIRNLVIEEDGPFFLIAGPCVIENEKTTLEVAAFLKETSLNTMILKLSQIMLYRY